MRKNIPISKEKKGLLIMHKRRTAFAVLAVLVLAGSADGAEPEKSIWQRERLANGFWGLSDRLAESGIELELGVTRIWQINTKGGISTHNKRGRSPGSYDIELTFDTEKVFGISGGSLYVHTEGFWSKSGSIDGPSVGSAFGVNADGRTRRAMDITELWWEQSMLDGQVLLRIGKLDITGGFECRGCPLSFDGSAFANDETAQFLNGALVNNPTIAFPDYGLGVVLRYNPIEWWYASAGVVDAQTDARETGFRTAFGKEDYFFYVFETGILPLTDSLQGAYRVGLWYDPQPKANTDLGVAGKNYRDDVGVYLSCDQMLKKENPELQDSQGLGAFFRFGYAPSRTNDITGFYSGGFQYQGLFDGRDDDVLGVGFGYGSFADTADSTYPEDYESILEIYYNAVFAPWLNISPSLQYIANPGGSNTAKDAVVFGLRIQSRF
jgi:porin